MSAMPTIFLSAILFLAQAAGAAQATGRVSGRLTTPDGGPAANIRVMAMAVDDAAPAGSVIIGSVQTDRSGNYRIEDLPPGRYYITAGLVEIPSYYPGVAQQSDATVVSVAARASVQRIDFVQVRPTSLKVSGRVVRTNVQPFQPMKGSEVALYLRGTPPLRTVTADDGTFEFQYVRPGTYDADVLGPVTANRVPVVVTDKGVTGLQLEVIPRNQVTGRVVVDGGGPTPRVTFSVEEAGGTVHMPAADMLSFTLTLPDGEPRITVVPGSLPAGYTVASFRYGRTDLLREPFRNTFSKDDEIVLTVRPPSRSRVVVRGRVVAMDLKVAGGRVTLTSPAFAENRSAEIRADGSFVIPGVPPGTYVATSSFVGAPTPSIVVGDSDLKNVEILVPSPSAASMDPEKVVASLAWVLHDAAGAVVERGNRTVKLKEVLVEELGTPAEPSTPKAIQLNTQFSLRLSENPDQFRSLKTSLSLMVRKDSDQSASSGFFTIDGPAHATRKNDGAELGVDVSQIAGRWEVTRTEFLTDVSFEGRVRTSWGAAAPPPIWRLTILKGSTITWPSIINGKIVAP
jgi:hypothetical protein